MHRFEDPGSRQRSIRGNLFRETKITTRHDPKCHVVNRRSLITPILCGMRVYGKGILTKPVPLGGFGS